MCVYICIYVCVGVCSYIFMHVGPREQCLTGVNHFVSWDRVSHWAEVSRQGQMAIEPQGDACFTHSPTQCSDGKYTPPCSGLGTELT